LADHGVKYASTPEARQRFTGLKESLPPAPAATAPATPAATTSRP
jgi:hypothetical protein